MPTSSGPWRRRGAGVVRAAARAAVGRRRAARAARAVRRAWDELSRHFTEPELIELCLLIGHYEMLAMTINSLRIEPDTFGGGSHGAAHPLAGKRVLITGAARGIGAATARRLSERGARVVVAGIEREQLEQVARDCGGIAVRVRRPSTASRSRPRWRCRRASRRARRRDRQRRRRRAAADRRRRSGDLRADDRRQPARDVLHAPRRRAPHLAPGRLRAGDRLAGRRRARAAARRLQRVEGGRRGARQLAAGRAGAQPAPASASRTSASSTPT